MKPSYLDPANIRYLDEKHWGEDTRLYVDGKPQGFFLWDTAAESHQHVSLLTIAADLGDRQDAKTFVNLLPRVRITFDDLRPYFK